MTPSLKPAFLWLKNNVLYPFPAAGTGSGGLRVPAAGTGDVECIVVSGPGSRDSIWGPSSPGTRY